MRGAVITKEKKIAVYVHKVNVESDGSDTSRMGKAMMDCYPVQ